MDGLNVERLREHWEDDPSIAQGFEERTARLGEAVEEIDAPRGYGGFTMGPPIDVETALTRLERQRIVETNEEILDLLAAWDLGLEHL